MRLRIFGNFKFERNIAFNFSFEKFLDFVYVCKIALKHGNAKSQFLKHTDITSVVIIETSNSKDSRWLKG